MGFGERFKGLRKPSEQSVKITRPDSVPEDDARLASLDALYKQGSLTQREYEQAYKRIVDGKD